MPDSRETPRLPAGMRMNGKGSAGGLDIELSEKDVPSNGAKELFARWSGPDAGVGKMVLCDGAMGTMLYARGIFINRCFDELNLSQPELVRTVHAEYLQAGAEVVETNTFGANAFRLERYGLRDKVKAINLAGIKLARQCVNEIKDTQSSEAYVAGVRWGR